MNKLIITGALGAILATGAFAQSTTAPAEPMTEPESAVPETVPGTVAENGGWDLMDGQTRVEVSTVSADELIGSPIETVSGDSIAKVDDVIMSDTGSVESIAASFGGFLGFGTDTVLLTLDEVDFVNRLDDALVIRTNLTPELLEGRPAYEGT